MEKIAIVGGGLSGSLISVYFAKRGFEVHLFEKRADMRVNRISAGKSINLALSTRGIHALQKIGLDSAILDSGLPMSKRMMHSISGELTEQPYGKEGQAIYSVSRGLLNIRLLEMADDWSNIHIYFEHDCVKCDTENGSLEFETPTGVFSFIADRIIGTDGAYSAIRHEFQMAGRFNYSQQYLDHGYKELNIPPGPNGSFLLDKNSLHIWPRKSFLLIALPNIDGSFTLTLFFPMKGDLSFDSIKTKSDVKHFFETYFADVMDKIEHLEDSFLNNPIGSLVTVKCNPWVNHKAVLLGDAAHAIVPFYGQGMNCSFEDCVIFDKLIEEHYPNWNCIYEKFEQERKPNSDSIADLALQNFIEMRDLVGTEEFLKLKHIEHDLAEYYPDWFKSQYELVTFSNVPYQIALNQGAKNMELLQYIANHQMEIDLNNKESILLLFEQFGFEKNKYV